MSMNFQGDIKPQIKCGKSRTKQSFKDEVNINSIIKKYRKTGLIKHVNANPGRYEDVSDVRNFHEAQNIIAEGKQMFNALPANVRERFQNDPGQLISFLDNPDNKDEAIKLGLCRKPKLAPKPPAAPPATPPATPPADPPAAPPETSPDIEA